MEKKTLLIADDIELNRAMLRDDLSDEYEIFEAENGEETLEILKTVQVDALILDVVMPKLDGIGVLKQIKSDKKYREMVILVVTATMEQNGRLVLELGADDILPRPCDHYVMRKRLENLLVKKKFEKNTKEAERSFAGKQGEEKRIKVLKDVEEMKNMVDIMTANLSDEKLVKECAGDIYKRLDEMKMCMI